MSPRRTLILAVLSLALAAPLAAQDATSGEYPGLETGKMWTFDQAPLGYWAKRYNFRPNQQWIDHVRQSAVRYGGGCSASFVSGNGLVMTNHHCARACVESSTKPGEDLLGDGFYAGRREDERACQGLFLDQLQEITEVTDSVARAIPAGATPAVAAEKRAEVVKRIEDRCKETSADAACQVVAMYRGGKYMLYRFRRYSDIRLVFAVESQTAFFGGDPDNFTYPRHDLDVAMVRAYVDGRPAVTDYLHWARTGSKEGDLVFVVGNPGSTGRLNSMAQLEYLRDIQYPMTLDALARQIAVYQELSAMDTTHAKALRNTLFSLQNTQKAIAGYQTGLVDPALMQQKKTWEAGFRTSVRTNAELRSRFGDPWSEIERIRTEMRSLAVRRQYYSFSGYGSRLLPLAGILLRRPTETAKPDADRLPAYKEANKAAVERTLASTTPIDVEQETRLLTAWFTAMQKDLPASDPVLLTALRGQSPAEAARSMVAESRIKTAAERQALAEGGVAAITASTDPFIKLAVMIDPKERDVSKRWTDLVNREATQDEQVARALLAVYGSAVAPDATFSLRISDGEIKRYPLNGTVAQPYTTFYGLYDRHFAFGGEEPWQLTRRWVERRDSLNLSTPFNVVGTPDIIGGNSGSPVINRDGEVVGLIFDGNIEMLPNRFLFTERVARSVWIDSRAIIEALREVYDAGTLADELEGTS